MQTSTGNSSFIFNVVVDFVRFLFAVLASVSEIARVILIFLRPQQAGNPFHPCGNSCKELSRLKYAKKAMFGISK